jgi:anti-sigma factor RsiW
VLGRAYDYFERRLPADAAAAIDAHVAGCASCGDLWTKARETTCREFAGFLDDYVEGRLSPERLRIFERHLSICDACVEYLKSYETTRRACKAAHAANKPPAPAEMPERLLKAILEARRAKG